MRGNKELPCQNCLFIEMGEMACYQETCPDCGRVPPSRTREIKKYRDNLEVLRGEVSDFIKFKRKMKFVCNICGAVICYFYILCWYLFLFRAGERKRKWIYHQKMICQRCHNLRRPKKVWAKLLLRKDYCHHKICQKQAFIKAHILLL